MQQVITIRASQGDLNEALRQLTNRKWKVVSVVRGSEWGRIGFSYKWTVVLEGDEKDNHPNWELESIRKVAASKSYGKAAALFVGVLVGMGAFIGILYAICLAMI